MGGLRSLVSGRSVSFFWALRRRDRRKNQTSPRMMAAPATPPTTPPAIAPLFVDWDWGFLVLGLLFGPSVKRKASEGLSHTEGVGEFWISPAVLEGME